MKAWKVMAVIAFGALCALPAAAQEIDINTATQEELEELPGIGSKLAERIIKDRRENGPFSSVEDLARVPGVPSSVIQRIASKARAGGSSSSSPRRSAGGSVGNKAVREVLAKFSREPSVREVQEAALGYVRAHPDIIDSWRARARTNALLPELRARFDYDINDDLSTRRDADTGSTETKQDDKAYQFEFRATWDLDRLVFEPQELATTREAVRLANLRDRVLDEVTRRYYERRRLQVDMELSPPTDVGDAVRKELRVQELTADIDSLTGGWFGRELEKAGQRAY